MLTYCWRKDTRDRRREMRIRNVRLGVTPYLRESQSPASSRESNSAREFEVSEAWMDSRLDNARVPLPSSVYICIPTLLVQRR